MDIGLPIECRDERSLAASVHQLLATIEMSLVDTMRPSCTLRLVATSEFLFPNGCQFCEIYGLP